MGRRPHQSYQVDPQQCSLWAHSGRQGAYRIRRANEERCSYHWGSLCSFQGIHNLLNPFNLYWPSNQETAKLESEVFVQRQKVALATELKAVLDSWVRYEQQVKESEQAQLAQTVIDKVLKSLSDEKTQRDILTNAVAEVERKWETCSYLIYTNFILQSS